MMVLVPVIFYPAMSIGAALAVEGEEAGKKRPRPCWWLGGTQRVRTLAGSDRGEDEFVTSVRGADAVEYRAARRRWERDPQLPGHFESRVLLCGHQREAADCVLEVPTGFDEVSARFLHHVLRRAGIPIRCRSVVADAARDRDSISVGLLAAAGLTEGSPGAR